MKKKLNISLSKSVSKVRFPDSARVGGCSNASSKKITRDFDAATVDLPDT